MSQDPLSGHMLLQIPLEYYYYIVYVRDMVSQGTTLPNEAQAGLSPLIPRMCSGLVLLRIATLSKFWYLFKAEAVDFWKWKAKGEQNKGLYDRIPLSPQDKYPLPIIFIQIFQQSD